MPPVASPGLPLWWKGLAATPSTHSIQPSWLHRTPPIVTSRAGLCRCAFVLRSHVGRVVFTSLKHDEGVSKRLKHPPLALVRELLFQLQPRTSLTMDGSRAPPCAWTSPCVASFVQSSPRTFNPNFKLMLVLPRRRTFRPSLALSPTTTVCDEARGTPPNVTDDDQAHVNPHPVAHLIVLTFQCVTVVCSGRCGIHCCSQVRTVHQT